MEKLTWQKFLDRLTKVCKLDDGLTKFKSFSTDIDRLKYCYEHKLISTKLAEWRELNPIKIPKKDSQISNKYKGQGNRAYINKNDEKALEYYNQGILFAPLAELSVLHSNRSAVLYSKGLYKESLADIKLALEIGFPQAKQWKLYKRQGDALLKLQKYDDAKVSFLKAEELLNDSDTHLVEQRKDIQSSLCNIASGVMKIDNENMMEITSFEPLNGFGDTVVCGSKNLQLCFEDKRGRYITARNDIKAGSIIISEKPYAAVLLPPWYHSHCQHCFSKVNIMFSCDNCTEVCYCSIECKEESWNKYHRKECGLLNLMEKIGIAHLAFRIILVTDFKDVLHCCNQSVRKPDTISGCDEDGVYRSSYESVFHLLPHSKNLQAEDLFQYTVAGLLLYSVLEDSQMLSDYEKDDCFLVGSSLVRHIQQLVCNAHAVTALVDNNLSTYDTNVVEQEQVRIATAIYPTTSLLNHSCEATILNSFSQDRLIVKVIKDVKKGEEIFNCYGPHFKRMRFIERQQILKDQYFFTCECLHCLKDASEKTLQDAFICKTCKIILKESPCSGTIHCSACNSEFDFSEVYELPFKESKTLFSSGLELLQTLRNKEGVRNAVRCFLRCLNIQRVILNKNHLQLAGTYDLLAKSYVILKEYNQALDYLTASVAIVETHYGKNSIELTNEILKLSDVYFELLQQSIDQKDVENIRTFLPNALKTTETCIKLLELNKGPGNEDLIDLKQKHISLTQLRFMPVLS